MEIEIGIETLDGSMVNPMVSWITSSSLGASLVDHLSTIRFHAILCLLLFFFFSPSPSLPAFPQGYDSVVSRREITFEEVVEVSTGEGGGGKRGRGLAHLHGGSCVFATLSIVIVETRVGILGISSKCPGWMNENRIYQRVSSSFYTFYTYIFEYFRASRETSKINCPPWWISWSIINQSSIIFQWNL